MEQIIQNKAVGYNKEKVETLIALLNGIPVKSFVETQAKFKIYEILMSPDYEFEPPTETKE